MNLVLPAGAVSPPVFAANQPALLTAAIFDVDGGMLASPHERARREALVGIAGPARFTTAVYQAQVAGKPRLPGARAALEALGVPDAERQGTAELRMRPARCFVAEDAPAGIQAARAGGMAGLGVAPLGDAALRRAQDATIIVSRLDEFATDELARGHLARPA